MQYNNVYPAAAYSSTVVNPALNKQMPTQQQQSPQPGLVVRFISSEDEAKSFSDISAGSSAILMDTNADVFYIKSIDDSGMPMPLRVFDYKERLPDPGKRYVTYDELTKILDDLTGGGKS
jgi:hypothetical protein